MPEFEIFAFAQRSYRLILLISVINIHSPASQLTACIICTFEVNSNNSCTRNTHYQQIESQGDTDSIC